MFVWLYWVYVLQQITYQPSLKIKQASAWDTLVYILDDVKIVTRGFGVVEFCFIFSRYIPHLPIRGHFNQSN